MSATPQQVRHYQALAAQAHAEAELERMAQHVARRDRMYRRGLVPLDDFRPAEVIDPDWLAKQDQFNSYSDVWGDAR